MINSINNTPFPKSENHIPKWYIIDAENKTLGRLSTEISILLRGKTNILYTPGINQGNFVIVINAQKIKVTGKKTHQKNYFFPSRRPGNLKSELYKDLLKRLPTRILERSIWGMLPKGVLGRKYYKRLYIYKDSNILIKKN
jgi:large subunit ribosomal protein L13